MIRLYTLYADMLPPDNAGPGERAFEEMQTKVAARNRVMAQWLIRSDIGPYPKTPVQHQRHLPKLCEYSTLNPMLRLLFCDSRDGSCTVIANGTTSRHADIEAATRSIYQIATDPIVLHRDGVFDR